MVKKDPSLDASAHAHVSIDETEATSIEFFANSPCSSWTRESRIEAGAGAVPAPVRTLRPELLEALRR